MDMYTVSFFGHRQIDNFCSVERRLEAVVRALLSQHEYVEFLIGRNGEFDQMAASTIHRLKRLYRSDNSSITLVLPYMTAEARENTTSFESYYDSIEVSAAAAAAHFKSAIQLRNRDMVDRSDLVICYVERKNGGAHQTIKYAERSGKAIINVAKGE